MPPQSAGDRALKRLGVREHSSAEMRAYLVRRGFDPAEIDATIAELVEDRLIDDARYARALANAQAARGKGPAYLRMKLRGKGISASNSEARLLLDAATGTSQLEAAREIVRRRYPGAPNDERERMRAFLALLRRGFARDVAREAAHTALTEP